MLPDPVWSALGKTRAWSVWFVRRAGWVVGVSMAVMMLPIVTEHQRLELEEMQNLQKRQVSIAPTKQVEYLCSYQCIHPLLPPFRHIYVGLWWGFDLPCCQMAHDGAISLVKSPHQFDNKSFILSNAPGWG